MQLKYFFPQDGKGAVLPFAEATVYNRGTTVPSTIYNASGSQISNPVQADEHGRIEFRAADGEYEVQFSYKGELGQKVPVDFVDTGEFAEAMEGQIVLATEQREQAGFSAEAAGISASAANNSKTAAQTAETNAKASETKAKTSETNSKASETASKTSETNAKASEVAAEEASTESVAARDQSLVYKNSAEAAKDASLAAQAAAEQAQAAAEAAAEEAGSGGGSVDLTPLARKDANLSDLADKTVALDNLKAMYKPDVDGLATFADLRSRAPKYDGERIYIKCHTVAGVAIMLPEGGGWFKGRMTAQADDGGYIASAGGAWHWVRDAKIESLTIAEFGGVADGITDAQPAFQRNYNFIMSAYARARTGGTAQGAGGYSPYLAIIFNIGQYYITPGQYNKSGTKVAEGAADAAFNPSGYYAAGGLSVQGAYCESGKLGLTWLKSDKSDQPVFLINHRRVNFKGIAFNGQQTTAADTYNAGTNPTGTGRLIGSTMGVWNDTASNKQQFVYNECPGGCYLKISCCSYQDLGGDMFFVKDTLDTKIDQIFGSKNAAPFFTASWSGQTVGVWDHSTSVEIRNCNFGTCNSPAIRAPRCAQSILFNVWAEHGSTPFDLNNGQWDMSMVCVEDCRADMCLWNTKWTMRTLSTPTGNDVSEASPTSGNYTGYLTNPDGSALTSWTEQTGLGSYLLMNYGAYFNAPIRANWYSGILRGTNNTDSVVWLNIGKFASQTGAGAPNGTSWRIRVNGSVYYNQSATSQMTSDNSPGVTIIDIGRGTGSTPKASWRNEGSGPCSAVMYKPQQYNTEIPEVWVCIKGRVGEYAVFVESTGSTRREAGVPSSFTPSGATQTTQPSGLTAIVGRVGFHNGTAGVGARDDLMEEVTRFVAATGVTETEPVYPTIVRWKAKMVNGQILAQPVYAFKPVFTTNPPATLSVATGATLTITTAVNYAVSQQWQKSTDGGTTFTNLTGTAVVLSIPNVTAADAGQYRLAVRSNNGSGGAGITSYSPVTTVTIT